MRQKTNLPILFLLLFLLGKVAMADCTLALKSNQSPRARSPWTKQEVIEVIQALAENSRPLSTRDMALNRGGIKSDQIVSKVTGRTVRASAVYLQAKKLFGSWRNALIASGLDPNLFMIQMKWTPSLVLKAIIAIKDGLKNADLSASKMQTDYSDADRILRQLFGQPVTTKTVYDRARHYFGQWDNALTLAGIDPKYHKKQFSWNAEKIVEALVVLKSNFPKLSIYAIQNDNPQYTEVLSRHFQHPVQTSSIYTLAARVYFNNFAEALAASETSQARMLENSY